ncbi:MAG TPA: hypothetical protein VF774_09045, partial [Pseudoduganella sp.]
MLKIQSTPITEIERVGTFTGIQQRLSEACEWLRSQGIRVSDNRIGIYLKIISELNNARDSNTLDDYHIHNGHAWINATFESQELISICNSLRNCKDKSIIARLKLAAKGQELFASDEADSASGRNIALELSTAGTFASTGHPIDFGGEADVR